MENKHLIELLYYNEYYIWIEKPVKIHISILTSSQAVKEIVYQQWFLSLIS